MHARALTLALWLAWASPALAAPEVRMPPGTRTDATGQKISSRGLRETTEFFSRDLAAKGIVVQQIGPYRVRGVELTRFVSQTPSTPWIAIHVVRAAGKTTISLVARPAP